MLIECDVIPAAESHHRNAGRIADADNVLEPYGTVCVGFDGKVGWSLDFRHSQLRRWRQRAGMFDQKNLRFLHCHMRFPIPTCARLHVSEWRAHVGSATQQWAARTDIRRTIRR